MKKETQVNHLLECIEKISERSHHLSDFTEIKLNPVISYAKDLAQYLGSTERQACWFAILFSISLHRSEIDLEDIASFLKCSILTAFKYIHDFEELARLKVLRKSKADRRRRRCPDRMDSIQFYVPTYIIQSISNGDKQLPKRQKTDMTVYELLDIFSNLMQERDNELLSSEEFEAEVIGLLSENQQISLVKSLKGFKLSHTDLLLLLYVCSEYTDYGEGDLITFLKMVYSDTTRQMSIRREFLNGKNKLQLLKLIDAPSDNFRSDRTIVLSEYAKDLFFGEDKELFLTSDKRKSDIILSSEILPERLYFNQKEQESIMLLSDLLKPENFKGVCSRMQDMGLRTGFNILVFGAPGVGKTSICMNLAKQSGRDLFKVSIEGTKSKWWGESERLIAGIFERYSRLVESYEITPIMFLNECDGILSSRISVQSSVSQTQNSMQNLLLEHMESLNGILLATTNLTQNLDKAFERRFLYKIELKNPDSITRELIIRDKIPGLTDSDYQTLSDNFELSGGQLENISRKYHLKQILSGENLNLSEIMDLCNEEFLEKSGDRKRIGFLS